MQKYKLPFFLITILVILFVTSSDTGCAQENPDSPPLQTVDEAYPANLPLDAAAFTPLKTIASFSPLSTGNLNESSKSKEYPLNLSSAIRLLLAPNPVGPNLAPFAVPSASSVWPVPTPDFDGGNSLHTPGQANDVNRNTYWSSHYGDGAQPWYRLIWAQPVTIARIFFGHGLPGGGPGSTSPGNRGHTTRFIQYYDLTSQTWLTIPNSVLYYGLPYPDWVDFNFSPVRTTGIIIGLTAGPANPHPNWCVALTEVEVYGCELSYLQNQSQVVFGLITTAPLPALYP